MPPALASSLDIRLAELMMNSLVGCDLGEGIEVVHDVESIEIEMDCDVDNDDDDDDNDDNNDDETDATSPSDETQPMLLHWFETGDDWLPSTTTFERPEDAGTQRFVRDSAPYERIELKLDDAFIRATIEEAKGSGGGDNQRSAHQKQQPLLRLRRTAPS